MKYEKIIAGVMTAAMLCAFTACSSKVSTAVSEQAAAALTEAAKGAAVETAAETEAAVPETTAAPEAAETASAANAELAARFAGDWHEHYAGRGMMTVTVDGDFVNFDVQWADSAFEYYKWQFSGTCDADGKIHYTGGIESDIVFESEDKSTTTIVSENESGTISINEDGQLVWEGYSQYDDEPALFDRDV